MKSGRCNLGDETRLRIFHHRIGKRPMSWAYAIIAIGLAGMIAENVRKHLARMKDIQQEQAKVERSIERNSEALVELQQMGEAIRHRLPPLLEEKETLKDEVAMKRQELEELEVRYARRHVGGILL